MKAVIHIGARKTGSSTIQSFLHCNRTLLKSRGIFIPSNAHSDRYALHAELLAISLNPDTWGQRPTPFASMLKENFTLHDQEILWEKCRHEIETNCRKNDLVLFSNEDLFFFEKDAIAKLKRVMNSIFDDITLVLYLRRQPEYLVSSHGTDVSLGGLTRCFGDARDYTYHDAVEHWSIFGKENLKIRIFDKQEFYNYDLIFDFAHTVGFDVNGLERVGNENETMIDSAETEYLRLFNFHNSDFWSVRSILSSRQSNSKEKRKAWHLNRAEARSILEQHRKGNDWIAKEYLGREKLFSEDVSMYPEEVDSPHGLTLEKSVEIAAHIYKELQAEKKRQSEEFQAETQRQQAELHHRDTEIQRLSTEVQQSNAKVLCLQDETHRQQEAIQHRDIELQRQQADFHRLQDSLALLQQKNSIYWDYYRCKVMAKITLGAKRKHYKEKRNALHEKVRRIRDLCRLREPQ